MVSARLTAQQKALLLCQHLQDGVPLTRPEPVNLNEARFGAYY